MIELLVVVAILALLSAIAVPAYVKYQNRAYETWVQSEISDQGQFLQLAYSVDGGYHQYLGLIGYKPAGEQLGVLGFKTGYGGATAPCCDIYGTNPPTNSSADFSSYSYIKAGVTADEAGANSHELCSASGASCGKTHPVNQIGSLSDHGLTNGSDKCQNLEATCECGKFTLIGASGYNRSAGTETKAKPSLGDFIITLNEKGVLCKPGSGGTLEPY